MLSPIYILIIVLKTLILELLGLTLELCGVSTSLERWRLWQGERNPVSFAPIAVDVLVPTSLLGSP